MTDAVSKKVWYVPSTRNNVVGALSAGMVMPALGYPKYFNDVAQLSPGRIVLSAKGSHDDWYGENPEDLQALIEFEVVCSGEVFPDGNGDSLMAVAAVFPTSIISRIHFASEGALSEFQARRYENVVSADDKCSVSPELFHREDVPPLRKLQPWLQSLPIPAVPTADDIRAVDAWAGAVLMALGSPSRWSSDLRIRRDVVARLLDWGVARPLHEHITDAMGGGWLSNDAPNDQELLRAMAVVADRLSPAVGYGSRIVLDEVRKILGENPAESIVVNLQRVDSILRAESELRPLTSDSGLRSAKALLLLLLRPDPIDAVRWSDEMPGDPLAILGACVLGGLITSARALPVDLKRGPLHDVVMRSAVDRINSLSPDVVEPFLAPNSLTLELSEEDNEGDVILRLDGVEVGRGRIAPQGSPSDSDAVQVDLFADGDVAPQKDERRPRGNAFAEFIESITKADLTDPQIAELCVEVCRAREWRDIVETIVRFAGPVKIEASTAVFTGLPVAVHRFTTEVFLERLSALGRIDGPEVKALARHLKKSSAGQAAR